MNQFNTNENFARSVREQIVSTAQSMLNGQLSFLIGSRRLASLRHDTNAAVNDADFSVFVAIDSETDAFPLGAVREHWDQDALVKLEPEIQKAELWATTVGADACKSLIDRYSE